MEHFYNSSAPHTRHGANLVFLFPVSTRCPQKSGSYPHVTAVIHRLMHSLLTTYPE
jgi:hypothetical protein